MRKQDRTKQITFYAKKHEGSAFFAYSKQKITKHSHPQMTQSFCRHLRQQSATIISLFQQKDKLKNQRSNISPNSSINSKTFAVFVFNSIS